MFASDRNSKQKITSTPRITASNRFCRRGIGYSKRSHHSSQPAIRSINSRHVCFRSEFQTKNHVDAQNNRIQSLLPARNRIFQKKPPLFTTGHSFDQLPTCLLQQKNFLFPSPRLLLLELFMLIAFK